MDDRESLLHHLREHYALIFNWHRERGPRRYREHFQGDIGFDDKWFRKYVHLVEQMPHPLEADAEAIAHIAHEVLTGCMEWSYMEKALPDVTMSEIAKAIEKMLREYTREEEESGDVRKLRALHNIGKTGSSPSCVEVRVPPSVFQPGDATYLKYARLAYSDVPTPNDEVNLGGFVALADTNVELQVRHHMGMCSVQAQQRSILFRNAKALHMVEDSSEDSLVGFTKSGAITILSVKIGGEED